MAKGSKKKGKKENLDERGIVKKLKKQFEFYFSDANLQKDKFLRKMIDEDENGYVDVAIFKKFNKVKALTDDFNLVIKAIKTLNDIEFSEDGERIRRCSPIPAAEGIDERTIYVEVIPKHIDHVWVRKYFDKFGEIVYVSIPKYKSTGDNKGFAFVEYKYPENAQDACRAYCGNLVFNDAENNDKPEPESKNVLRSLGKRKLSDSDAQKETLFEKKPKLDLREQEINDSKLISSKDRSDKIKGTIEGDDSNCKEINESKNTKGSSQRRSNVANPTFKVISKLEWLEYKMQYKEMQKEHMRKIKQNLHTDPEVVECPEIYCKSELSFQPGVIVRIDSTNEDGLQKKSIKSIIPDEVTVQYIDVIDGNTTGYVRLSSEDDTHKLLEKFANFNDGEHNTEFISTTTWHKLAGEEEKNYWEKITLDKKNRAHKQTIRRNKKGFEKILDSTEKKVTKHIHFPDD